MKRFIPIFYLILAVLFVGCAVSTHDRSTQNQIIISSSDELENALSCAKAGDRILLRAGTYEGHFMFSSDGEELHPIEIGSYSDEKAVLTTPKNSDGAAISVDGHSNIRISNLVFSNICAEEAYGILMTGGENSITVCNCEFMRIETTAPGSLFEPGGGANAILLFGESENAICNVSIENNLVHDNVNGWSENISVAGNCENISVNRNKVYNCSNIGIDFYGNAEYCDNSTLDQPRNCECIGNIVHDCKSFYAANAGIYIDGSYEITIKDNEVYSNPYGIEIGSEEWRSFYSDEKRVHGITVKDNLIHDNAICGLRIGGWTNDETTGVVFDCTVVGNRFENNNAEILLSKCDTVCFENNEFANGVECEKAVVYDVAISNGKITNIVFR